MVLRLSRSEIDLFPPLGIDERMQFPPLLQPVLQEELIVRELQVDKGFTEWEV